jgi:hypothetical protein
VWRGGVMGSPTTRKPAYALATVVVLLVALWDVSVTSRLAMTRSFPASDMVGNSLIVSRTMCSALGAHTHTITQSHNHTITQSHNHTITQSHNHTHTQNKQRAAQEEPFKNAGTHTRR